MKSYKRFYIYYSLVPLILTFLFFDGFMDLVFASINAEILLLFFTLISFILGVLGMILIFQAYTRKTLLWPLIQASLMASSLCIAFLGRFVFKVF